MFSTQYIIILSICITFDGIKHCQDYERDFFFQSKARCEFVSAIEKGQYYLKTRKRDWAKYTWRCEGLSWEKGYGTKSS